MSAAAGCGSITRSPEFAVVPGDDAVDGDLHDDALVEHDLDEGFHLLRVGALVALEDADAELEHPLRIVDDLGPADELDTSQLLVRLAGLDHAGDRRVPQQVPNLLRLRLGLERDRA